MTTALPRISSVKMLIIDPKKYLNKEISRVKNHATVHQQVSGTGYLHDQPAGLLKFFYLEAPVILI